MQKNRSRMVLAGLSSLLALSAVVSSAGDDLKSYELIPYNDIRSLEDYSSTKNCKISFEMTFTSFIDGQTLVPPGNGYGYSSSELSMTDIPNRLKEAFPREKLLYILDAKFPLAVIGSKSAANKLKTLKEGDKIMIYGKVKKKILVYQVKRTLYYMEITGIEKVLEGK